MAKSVVKRGASFKEREPKSYAEESLLNSAWEATQDCFDYIIIGAGYAGLNCVSAIGRLSPESTVLVVDARPEVGGCWNAFYQYVKLHQPASVFGVAGETDKWGLDSTTRLASRHSICDHFQRYAEGLPSTVSMMLSTTFTSSSKDANDLFEVSVTLPSGETKVLKSRYMIDARAFNYKDRAATAKKLISPDKQHADVLEVTPEDLLDTVRRLQGKDVAYFVIGAGKTGCDSALFLAKNAPADQRVIMVQGGGLYFVNRDKVVPQKTTWWGRLGYSDCTVLQLFFRIIYEYDGDNALPVMQRMEKDGLLIKLGKGQPRYSMFGIISPAEVAIIEKRAELVHGDYFASCEVGPGGKKVVTLKSGKTLEVAGLDGI